MIAKKIIRIVIIEDDDVIRKSYVSIINDSEKYICVADYDNYQDAIKNLTKDTPEIVLMDSVLPGISGFDGIVRIKTAYSKADIIILTLLEQDEQIFKALCAGASGFITKNISTKELIQNLDETVRGQSKMSTGIARIINHLILRTKKSQLTSKEIEVIQQLAAGKSYSMTAENLRTNKEIVRSQIKNIYQKLPLLIKSSPD